MPGFYTLTETRFINNSRSKQSKKYVEYIFVDIVKQEMYAKFQQKILVAGRRQRFQLFRQITGFSEIIELCLNLSIGFCIT